MSDHKNVDRRTAIAAMGAIAATGFVESETKADNPKPVKAEALDSGRFVRVTIHVNKKGMPGTIVIKKTGGGSFDTGFGILHQTHTSSARLERHAADALKLTSNDFRFSNNVCWDNSHTFEIRMSSSGATVDNQGEGWKVVEFREVVRAKTTNVISEKVFG